MVKLKNNLFNNAEVTSRDVTMSDSPFLCLIVTRNVLALMNEFDVTEGIITRDNYENQLNFYNASSPQRILDLKLATCNLNELLNQVRLYLLRYYD